MSTSRAVRAALSVMAITAAAVAAAPPSAAAGGWSAPVALGTLNGQNPMQLVTAGVPGGPAVVAWLDSGRVRAATRGATGGWSPTATVSPSRDNALSIAAVVRPNGSIVLAWAAQQTSGAVIDSALGTAAGSWTGSSPVSAVNLLSAWPVSLGTDGAGTVLAAWGQTDTARVRTIDVASLPVGGSWSAPAALAYPVGSSLRQVVVAENASGAAVVGWVRVANDLFGDVTTRPAGGQFGAPVNIAFGALRPLQYQIHSFRLGIDPAGRADAAWNTIATYVSAQRPDGSWTPASYFTPFSRVGAVTTATDATGTTTALWYDLGQMWSSTIAPAGTWSAQQTVLPGVTPIDLTLAANGTSLTGGWYDTGSTSISAALRSNGTWGTPVVLARQNANGWVSGVGTAPLGSGALVAWTTGVTATGTVSVSVHP